MSTQKPWSNILPTREFPHFREPIARYPEEYAALLAKVAGDVKHIEFMQRYSCPDFDNGYWPLMDCIGMLAVLNERRPSVLVELGSGNSTHWARACAEHLGLTLGISAIDPEPRRDVTSVTDEFVKAPCQAFPAQWYLDRLSYGVNSILSIDTSHVCELPTEGPFIYLDLLPSLPVGSWVHIHDQFLPWDYPEEWTAWGFNETYLVALMLDSGKWRVRLPVYYVMRTPALVSVLDPLWTGSLATVPRDGGSLWLEKVA